jgi:hypothetical protein
VIDKDWEKRKGGEGTKDRDWGRDKDQERKGWGERLRDRRKKLYVYLN